MGFSFSSFSSVRPFFSSPCIVFTYSCISERSSYLSFHTIVLHLRGDIWYENVYLTTLVRKFLFPIKLSTIRPFKNIYVLLYMKNSFIFITHKWESESERVISLIITFTQWERLICKWQLKRNKVFSYLFCLPLQAKLPKDFVYNWHSTFVAETFPLLFRFQRNIFCG